MFARSLRLRLFAIAVVFASLVIGGFAITTYAVVSDGLAAVAEDAAMIVASSAGELTEEAVLDAEITAGLSGLQGGERAMAAEADLLRRVPPLFEAAGLGSAEFALRNREGVVLWSSGGTALVGDHAVDLERVVAGGRPVVDPRSGGSPVMGLFGNADLGTTVIHTPVRMPGNVSGVLDVAYHPVAEERVIDAIRLPMTALAAVSLMLMIALMQMAMSWVLGLVADLRTAADSIDAGRLDKRLPEAGSHEIGQLAAAVNRLIDRLQKRADAQGRFVADASHELATPVAGIRGYTNILRAWGAEDEAVRTEAIDAIDRESRRMARLTSDLLRLLHADQPLRLKSEKFDLNVAARERLAAIASAHIERDIEFVGPEGDSMVMVGDKDRVEDVMAILLDNAAKYTPPGGSVTLETGCRRGVVTFTVSDTGQGIAPEDVPRLFDRFFRSEKARSEGASGFGLGLPIAKSIVETMGGRIEVTSELGIGTTFTVTLNRGRV